MEAKGRLPERGGLVSGGKGKEEKKGGNKRDCSWHKVVSSFSANGDCLQEGETRERMVIG